MACTRVTFIFTLHHERERNLVFSLMDLGIRHFFVNVVCFLLGNSPASVFYVPTFRSTLFRLHRHVGMKDTYLPMKMEQSAPKRRHMKFGRRGIAQKKA